MLEADPAYLQWLAGQDWFRSRYVVLRQTIINRGAEPEETPEHNALQARFLDDTFCWWFFRSLHRLTPQALEELRQAEIRELGDPCYVHRAKEDLATLSGPGEFCVRVTREFEVRGIDVALSASLTYAGAFIGHYSANVEIKPTVGDD